MSERFIVHFAYVHYVSSLCFTCPSCSVVYFLYFYVAPSAVKQIAPLGRIKGLSRHSHVIRVATKTTVSLTAYI